MVHQKKSIFLLLVLSLITVWGCKKDNPILNTNPVKIKAKFVADETNLKQGGVVNFTDSTIGFPLTWTWYFEGGIPATSKIQNPKNIKYNNLGSSR